MNISTATNQITSSGYVYDAAGNMTYDGSHSYTYDAEGNVWTVDGGNTATYAYNALNQRVQTVANGATTGFLFDASGERVSEWNAASANAVELEGNYYWGGRPVAYYTTAADTTAKAGIHFEHQNYLGTERMRTMPTGPYNSSNPQYAVEATFAEQPFGDNKKTFPGTVIETSYDTDANHYAFLDTDKETATDHADFRQYSNAQGRWMAPDPYDGSYSFGNPQSFNRYVYAANSPLSAIDPSGQECVWDDGSYDDNNDPETGAVDANGQHSNCTNAGGTWVDHSNFAGMPDWCSPDDANAGTCGYDTSLPNALWTPDMSFFPNPDNAVQCTTSTGIKFMAPPGFSISNIAANGATNGLSGATAAVAEFGYYDYQRYVTGPGTSNFYYKYTPVANIAVGAYLEGAGYGWASSAISNTYATIHSANGPTAQQAQFRNLGRDLASGKVTYTCQ